MILTKKPIIGDLFSKTDEYNQPNKMHHCRSPNGVTIEANLCLETVIEMFHSLKDPDTHIKNTLEMLYNDLSRNIFDIPTDCLVILAQLFLASSLEDNSEEDEDFLDEDFTNLNTTTSLGLIICIIFELVKNDNQYLLFFMNPEIINKLFCFYDIISRTQSLFNYLAQHHQQFIIDYRNNIIKLINTPPFTDSKAELLFEALKVDNQFFPVEKLLAILDSALISKNDTNLYTTSLDILSSLALMIPNEIIPNIVPIMPTYIVHTHDFVDNFNILKLYHNILIFLKSYNDIVNECFINFMINIISDKSNQDIKKDAFNILMFDYDLSPFIDYTIFFDAMYDAFESNSFIVQRFIIIFIARIMQICNKDKIQYFSNSVIIDNISYFLAVADDEIIIYYSLLIINTIMRFFPDKEWPDDVVDEIGAISVSSDEKNAQFAQIVQKQIFKDF